MPEYKFTIDVQNGAEHFKLVWKNIEVKSLKAHNLVEILRRRILLDRESQTATAFQIHVCILWPTMLHVSSQTQNTFEQM